MSLAEPISDNLLTPARTFGCPLASLFGQYIDTGLGANLKFLFMMMGL
jgi:hypothetical protein